MCTLCARQLVVAMRVATDGHLTDNELKFILYTLGLLVPNAVRPTAKRSYYLHDSRYLNVSSLLFLTFRFSLVGKKIPV